MYAQLFLLITMQYQVTKVDKRHIWHIHFDYLLEFSIESRIGTGVLDFDRARRWMNQTWDWSQDTKTRAALLLQNEDINHYWAYSVEYRDYRIYLKSEKELMFFQLAHAQSHS